MTDTPHNNEGGTHGAGTSRNAERGGRERNTRRSRDRGPRRERARPEYDHKVIDVRRVARVVAGGRRFSFSVTLVAGNHKGIVGVGMGKGADTALAIDKAMRDAKRTMISIPLSKTGSIAHNIEAKYSSAEIMMYPSPGKGLIAGGSVRDVLALGGVTDVGAKVLSGSKNRLNIGRATLKALMLLKGAKWVQK